MSNPLIDENGAEWWYNDERKLHRENGPAIILNNGTKVWVKNGEWHREGGPAVEYADGSTIWMINDVKHRIDGPAVNFISGTKEWWYNGKRIDCTTQEEFDRLIRLELFW